MKIFNTRYCLTNIITEHDVKEWGDRESIFPSMAKGYNSLLLVEGRESVKREWHKSLESATLRAKEAKKEKLVSLNRAIKRLNTLDF